MIRNIQAQDSAHIAAIYNHYINHTVITFETHPISSEAMEQRIKSHNTALPWIVYEEKGEVLGYAYATNWRSRNAYRFSTESSIYLGKDHHGKGIGSKLYQALLDQLKDNNIHAVIGGISLPNESSIALHEKFGFQKVAHFKEVGYKFDRWIDVGYWQLTLNT